jgi:hypothetical protein
MRRKTWFKTFKPFKTFQVKIFSEHFERLKLLERFERALALSWEAPWPITR